MSTILPTRYPLGVHVGNPDGGDPVAEAAYEANEALFVSTMGAAPQFIVEYVDQRQSIDTWVSNAGWSAWSAAQSSVARGMTPVIGLPMASTAAGSPSADQTYKNFMAGAYDAMLQGVVKAWADNGFKTQYWRPGWEMNLNSSSSYAGDDAATRSDWVAAFQHISTVLHAAGAADGVNVQVVWNPGVTNYSNVGPATQTIYPGNQYVDVIGADVYADLYPYGNQSALYDWDKSGQVYNSAKAVYDSSLQQWASDPVNLTHYWTDPAATQWSADGSVGHSLSLQDILDFAKAQGKPVAIAETGAGNTGDGAGVSDDPAFVQWLSATLAASSVPISFVNVWDSNGGGSYEFSKSSDGKPLEAAAWAKYFGAQSPAPPVDMIDLHVAEDAWQGDAQYTIAIDGTTIGGVHTATSSHALGQSQDVQVSGNWGSSAHTIGITFINDAYGGSPTTDRNLYVNGVLYDGRAATGAPAVLYANGTRNFVAPAAASNTAIVLHLAEDAWQGDAQYSVAIDGHAVVQMGTVTVANASGSSQSVALQALLTPGAHDLAISFLNDAYGGSPTTDRNLYVKGIDVNGTAVPQASAAMYSTQTNHFQIGLASF